MIEARACRARIHAGSGPGALIGAAIGVLAVAQCRKALQAMVKSLG